MEVSINEILEDSQDSQVALEKWLKMVDITIVFMGVISWFINQLISGGPHPV